MSLYSERFLAHYHNAPISAKRAGATWYDDARNTARTLARESGRTVAVAAGVIAALSPRAHWKTNITWARASLVTGKATGGLRVSVRKAQAIIDGGKPLDVLSGPKVRAFYRAIMGHSDAAVVDVWIARAARVNSDGWTVAQYNTVARALIEAAKAVRKPVSEFQATVWIAVRGKAQ